MSEERPPISEHEYEDQLEPTHLIRRSHVVLRAGTMMLGAGTSALRVREVMSAVARTVGVQQGDAAVLRVRDGLAGQADHQLRIDLAVRGGQHP